MTSSTRLQLLVCLVVAAFGLGACRLFGADQTVPLELDYAEVLPEGWTPLGEWHEVNIDGDADVEFLLLYTYDNGQAGAVIYDIQANSEFVRVPQPLLTPLPTPSLQPIPIPLQGAGFYIPYRILPNYWRGSYHGEFGQGIVAAPSETGSISIVPIPNDEENADAESTQPSGQLVLLGGATHLTFVWWKNVQEGYGVTQFYAPGGFRGVNWQEWQDDPTQIMQFTTLTPVTNTTTRSLFCRAVQFQRTVGAVDDGQTPNRGQAVGESAAYVPEDKGVTYCISETPPPYPFYPEGVVLTYLLLPRVVDRDTPNPAREQLVTPPSALTPGTTVSQLDARIHYTPSEIINDITARLTVSTPPLNPDTSSFVLTTPVCIELAKKVEDSLVRRWLLFTLLYWPPDQEERTSDRWTISSVAPLPSPTGIFKESYCQKIIDDPALVVAQRP